MHVPTCFNKKVTEMFYIEQHYGITIIMATRTCNGSLLQYCKILSENISLV